MKEITLQASAFDNDTIDILKETFLFTKALGILIFNRPCDLLETVHPLPPCVTCVTCDMCVTCQVSRVRCHVSGINVTFLDATP